MLQIFPALKLHVWGGLGSQLFAVALFYDLKLKFPNRRIVLILHSSGVTKRYSEIEGLFPELSCSWVDDFGVEKTTGQNGMFSKMLLNFFRQVLKRITIKLGLIASLNTNGEFENIRFWVLQIRGHYSHRTISLDYLYTLSKRIGIVKPAIPPMGILGIHYRLGDLLSLQDKNPIDSKRLVQAIRKILNEGTISELALYSDSPAEALARVREISIDIKVNTYTLNAIDTLNRSLTYEIFIGTNSKISLWIAYLRFFHSHLYSNILPKELESTFRNNHPKTNAIRTY